MRTLQEDFSSAGMTTSAYIRDRRLHFAKTQLIALRGRARSGTIADLAFESGFSDISYFNRSFRKAFGCSPSDIVRN